MRQSLRILWFAGLAGLIAVSAAADQGDWTLRFGGIGVDSDMGFSEVDEDGARVDLSTNTGAGVGVSAEFQRNPRVGVEIGAMQTSNDVELTASFLGMELLTVKDTMTPTTVSLGANFHLSPDARGDFYAGPVVAYMVPNDIRFTFQGESIDVQADNATGFGAVMGFDYPFGDQGWMFCTSLRYLEADLDFVTEGDRDTLAYDPLVFGIGLGYRF